MTSHSLSNLQQVITIQDLEALYNSQSRRLEAKSICCFCKLNNSLAPSLILKLTLMTLQFSKRWRKFEESSNYFEGLQLTKGRLPKYLNENWTTLKFRLFFIEKKYFHRPGLLLSSIRLHFDLKKTPTRIFEEILLKTILHYILCIGKEILNLDVLSTRWMVFRLVIYVKRGSHSFVMIYLWNLHGIWRSISIQKYFHSVWLAGNSLAVRPAGWLMQPLPRLE